MTPEGQFFILEVNPNPFLNSAGVTNGLGATGRTHSDFVASLLRAALARRVGRCECIGDSTTDPEAGVTALVRF